MKRRKKRTAALVILLISVVLLIAIVGFALLKMRSQIKESIQLEAGSDMVDSKEFLINPKKEAEFITDLSTIDMNRPGIHEIEIKVGNKIYQSTLELKDTIPPKASPRNKMSLKGQEVEPMDFVTDLIDSTTVTASYKSTPDFAMAGKQEVFLVLEDLGGNRTELTAMLTILDVKGLVEIEAGSAMELELEDFVINEEHSVTFETDITTIDTTKPALHEILIKIDGMIATSYIEVVDTTPPSATPLSPEIWLGETMEAVEFVTDIVDYSDVEVFYKVEPMFNQIGEQVIEIVLEDQKGNQTEYETTLIIEEDIEPPVISGVWDKTIYIGDSISYKGGVSVTDNKDEDVKLSIDSSKVNLKQEGTYAVVYSATDSSGNKTTKTMNLTVKKLTISEDQVYGLADQVLGRITTDQMSLRDKAWEIYQWVKGHVAYTGTSDKSDWLKEAYRGIENGIGDCFTYYAVSEALLTRAGIDNMRVTRVGGRTQHFWNLINCGDGWYHFDTCPHKDHFDSFMLTDAEVAEYTEIRGNNYYTFDTSLYPATPEE